MGNSSALRRYLLATFRISVGRGERPVNRSIVEITPLGLRGAPALGLLVMVSRGIVYVAGTGLSDGARTSLLIFYWMAAAHHATASRHGCLDCLGSTYCR